jgi:hypothetical protein
MRDTGILTALGRAIRVLSLHSISNIAHFPGPTVTKKKLEQVSVPLVYLGLRFLYVASRF